MEYGESLERIEVRNQIRKQMGMDPVPPLAFEPDPWSFWDIELKAMMKKYNVITFADMDRRHYKMVGDGIRLHLPMEWIMNTPKEELTARLIQGIEVSRSHASQLGY